MSIYGEFVQVGAVPVGAEARRTARVARLREASGAAQGARSREGWAGQDAAVYCRISHVLDQDQTGVERQERICREIADRYGLVIRPGHVFVDNNRSAWQRNRKRQDWDRMLGSARTGEVRHIICYHPDRLMRQPADLEELLTIAEEYGITLHGQANRRDLSEADDRFLLRIEVAHACRSSDDTSRRLRDFMVDRAREGLYHGARGYGYAIVGKGRLVIVEDEARIVREVFARFLDGQTPRGIAQVLVGRGVRTSRGATWRTESIRHLLRAPHVAGIRMFRGEAIGRGEWEAIIDEGTFREVQERLAYRGSVFAEKNARTRFYRLRGLVMCGKCGTMMSGTNDRYTCVRAARLDQAKCRRSIARGTLDAFVTQAAVRQLQALEAPGEPVSTVLPEHTRAQLAAEQAELAELKEMWDAREITAREYRQMRRTVEQRLRALQTRTVIRPAAAMLKGLTGPGAPEAWQRLEDARDNERMNAILRFLFASVTIAENTSRGGRVDLNRVTIEPNPL